jgi:hypothetical protein
VQILSPAGGADVGGRVDIVVEASDPGPVSSGIQHVRVYAEEQGGSRSVSIAILGGPGPKFRTSWTIPACIGPQDAGTSSGGRGPLRPSTLASVRVKTAGCGAQASSSSGAGRPDLV